MKERKLLDAIGMADEEYVQEAAPKDRRRIRHPFYIAIAVCFCLLLTVSAVGIAWGIGGNDKNAENLPSDHPITEDPDKETDQPSKVDPDKETDQPSKEDAYKDSEYYDVIKVLGGYYDYLDSLPEGDTDTDTDADMDMSGVGQRYIETTDNQEQGVIEGDLLKRSSEYAYYLDINERRTTLTLRIFSIDGTNTARVTRLKVATAKSSIYDEQLYLSSDCQTLTVAFSSYDNKRVRVTEVYSYDVSNLPTVTQKGFFSIKGSLEEARMVDDDLILVTGFYASVKERDYSNISQYIPSYDAGNGEVFFKPDEIHCPETVRSSQYLVFVTLDTDDLTVIGKTALLSYTRAMYFTSDTVYVGCVKSSSEDGVQTVLSALRYRGQGGMQMLGSATVNGTIRDQYSMDEHEGILRVVTSANSSADLYCISLADYTVKAKVEGFAPKRETVQSVRFDGDYAYVCTAVQMSDPVFFFDLSDLSNITYKHTGEIPGYSHSLVDFGDGYLLGIGYDEDDDEYTYGKIEIYKESDNSVVTVCQYNVGSWIDDDYKAYYIDREKGLIGFMYQECRSSDVYLQRYILLAFDGSDLNVVFNQIVRIDSEYSSMYDKTRAFSDGDYLYVFANANILEIHAIIPNVSNQSTLDFYIGQNVDDVDFSEYEIRYTDNYGSVTYYGKGYVSDEPGADPKQNVLYTVSSYPDHENKEKHITCIYIGDPSVKLWGMTVESSAEKFTATMTAKGFQVEENTETVYKSYRATKGNYHVFFSVREKYFQINLLSTENFT